MPFRKAERKKAKLRLALSGPSGSGKTYSALLIAFGIGGKVAMIDTERGSGELYAHLGDYDVCTLEPPFTPQKYIQAIKEAENLGYDVLIIDSLSHAWAGQGGMLEMHDSISAKSGNSWAAWRQVTPQHNALVDAMLQSSCHIIATLRAKTEYAQTEENGKTVIKRLGLAPVFRDGIEYEFTVFLDLTPDHTATASKDRTGLLDGQAFVPDQKLGQQLLTWLESGVEISPQPQPHQQNPPMQQPRQRQASDMMTEAQKKKIFAMWKELGLEKETMTAIMQERYGKSSSKELTKAEASDMIEYLTKLENGEESWIPGDAWEPESEGGSVDGYTDFANQQ